MNNLAASIKLAYEQNKNDESILGIQNIFTPIDDLTKYYDFISVVKTHNNIAILFNVEFLEFFLRNSENIDIKNKQFTYFYDSIMDRNFAIGIMMNYNYMNVNLISIETFSKTKNIKDLISVMANKHFDIIFTHPPYNRNIDLNIINDIIEKNISDKLICVHPTTFIFSKNLLKNKEALKKSLTYINMFWGNIMFHITCFVPLCISCWNINNKFDKIHVIDNSYSNEEYDSSFDKIMYYGKRNEQIFQFKLFIEQYMRDHFGSVLDHHINAEYKNMTNYSIRFAAIRGSYPLFKDGIKPDVWTLVGLNNIDYCDSTFRFSKAINNHPTLSKQMTLWSFINENERNNFVNYCKSKIVRFLLSFTKINANVMSGSPCRIIPWMDFSRSWTDKDLCKEFGIDKELWNYIDKFIPNYYDDYKSGFEEDEKKEVKK